MALSADQFKQIVASLKSDAPDRGTYEKRAAPRVGLRTKVTIYMDGDPTRPTDVWVRDLSANGIGFVHGRPIEQNREFLIKFPMCGNHWLSVVYSVMHCKDLSKNLYFVGARLDRINEQ
jgi:hypothetical protein